MIENVSGAAPTARLRTQATCLPLQRNQVFQNLAHVTDGQRIMTSLINETRFAVRQASCDFFRKLHREGSVLLSMPKPHWSADVFQGNSPWPRVNLRIRHDAFSRSTPGAALTLKNGFERSCVTQAFGIARSQHQRF